MSDPTKLTERDRWAWEAGYRAGVEEAAKSAEAGGSNGRFYAAKIRALAEPADSRDQGDAFRAGAEWMREQAALGCDEYAKQKQAQHLHPTAYALREIAVTIRSLPTSPPAPEEDKP